MADFPDKEPATPARSPFAARASTISRTSTSRSRAISSWYHRPVGFRQVLARLRHHLCRGQRRYVESLSAYARQFLEMMQKPDVDQIDGLSPAISIEQKTTSKNPRSTVGTVTEIYDYARLLWARIWRALFAGDRTSDRKPDRVANGRSRAGAAGWHAHLRAGAGGARPQGRIQEGTRRVSQEGLPARQDRRRLLRDRRRQAARQRNSPTISTSWSTAWW